MKEKIRKILTIDRGVVYGDFPGLITDLEPLINQEVEKRIAERMPSEEEINRKKKDAWDLLDKQGYPPSTILKFIEAMELMDILYRNRMKALDHLPDHHLDHPENAERQMWRDIQERERDNTSPDKFTSYLWDGEKYVEFKTAEELLAYRKENGI